MPVKKSLYPKTERLSIDDRNVIITEKLDGSNIGFFKLNNQLIVSTRNNIFTYPNEEISDYKGIKPWLEENANKLNLCENSGFFGEWIGQGQLKYPHLNKKVYMYAKANIDENYNITNIYYDLDYFIYPFEDQVIPDCIDMVPIVKKDYSYPTIDELNLLYDQYKMAENRNVEGFVINQFNTIRKYVRMKNGKLTNHRDKNQNK